MEPELSPSQYQHGRFKNHICGLFDHLPDLQRLEPFEAGCILIIEM
jgi:hypothetical protein